MNGRIFFATLLVILSLVLAACGPAVETQGTPGLEGQGFQETETPQEFGQEEGPIGPETTEPVEPSESTPVEPVEPTTPAETEANESSGIAAEMADPGRVSALLEFNVVTRNGEEIGPVEDLVLDLENVRSEYVVVEVGGFLGIGSKLAPIPWALVELDATAQGDVQAEGQMAASERTLVVDATQDMLANAPEIDLEALPDAGEPDEGWDAEIEAYWETELGITDQSEETQAEETQEPAETEPAATDEAEDTQEEPSPQATSRENLPTVILASELLNLSMPGQGEGQGEGQGQIAVEDVILVPESGELQYLVIRLGSNADQGAQLIPIPIDLLIETQGRGALVAELNPQVVRDAPSFTPENFPNTQEPDWDAEIRSYWGQNLQSDTQ